MCGIEEKQWLSFGGYFLLSMGRFRFVLARGILIPLPDEVREKQWVRCFGYLSRLLCKSGGYRGILRCVLTKRTPLYGGRGEPTDFGEVA